eukprot:CAMPEP_0119272982 /NCGR_PEP_ID=MMETSP1329-20130426/9392_1 /TAXON_ID=114041 /ORGANISM="Genus nov. species nov., Strain RCC1024" /LENGTH=207 /DNA_ID=CAMNT_0007273131 /DNA_START=42 /DNA_END=662 /DNA_ORIENTATION=+
MNRLLLALALLAPAAGFVGPAAPKAPVVAKETVSDLEALAMELNPVVGYWNPLGLFNPENAFQTNYWDQGTEATISWFRHAEIKHGRVAMLGFVGFLAQAQGVTWPFKMTLAGDSWPALGEGGVPAQWDALPEASKWQIIAFVGFCEFWSECSVGGTHYMRGGKPGAFPSFAPLKVLPLDLYDPTGAARNASPEKKARGRLIEINNG